MSLSEDISHILNGRRSGKGFRVKSVCHDGDGMNLYLSDAPDGKLLANCFSHGCSYKKIMESLELLGLKPKPELTYQHTQNHCKKVKKQLYQKALFIELHILLQVSIERIGDINNAKDIKYLKLHPEFAPMPDEPFERELMAAKRTKKLIGKIYGI